jgi:hypothetical protein
MGSLFFSFVGAPIFLVFGGVPFSWFLVGSLFFGFLVGSLFFVFGGVPIFWFLVGPLFLGLWWGPYLLVFCVVFLFFVLCVFILCIVYPMLPVSLDYPFVIAPFGFL